MTEDRKQRLAQKYAALYASSGRANKKEPRMVGGGGRMMGMAAQGKPKDTKKTIKRLVWYLSREWILIIVGIKIAHGKLLQLIVQILTKTLEGTP